MDKGNLERRLRQAAVLDNLRVILPAAVILAMVTCLFFWSYAWLPLQAYRDVQGAPPQQGVAVVTGVTPGVASRGNQDLSGRVSLRIGGKVAQAETRMPVRVGQRVQVMYRIGKSGRLYVDSIKALTDRGPAGG